MPCICDTGIYLGDHRCYQIIDPSKLELLLGQQSKLFEPLRHSKVLTLSFHPSPTTVLSMSSILEGKVTSVFIVRVRRRIMQR